MKNKHGEMSISIVLLVLMTLLLVTTSLFYLNSRESKKTSQLYSTIFLEDLYSSQLKLNFYIQDLVEQSAKISNNKQEFIDNFKNKLNYYQYKEGAFAIEEFNQLPNQLNEENVEFSGGKASIIFKISIVNNVIKENEQVLFANYTYTKKFETTIQ